MAKRVSGKNEWQLQDAKARFSEVFRLARARGRRKGSLVQFFARSPLANSGIRLEREPDYGRTARL